MVVSCYSLTKRPVHLPKINISNWHEAVECITIHKVAPKPKSVLGFLNEKAMFEAHIICFSPVRFIYTFVRCSSPKSSILPEASLLFSEIHYQKLVRIEQNQLTRTTQMSQFYMQSGDSISQVTRVHNYKFIQV